MAVIPKHDIYLWCPNCMVHNYFDLTEADDKKRVYQCTECSCIKEFRKWITKDGKIAQDAKA